MATNKLPKRIPTLYQHCVEAFVNELPNERIAELYNLPAVVVISILEEMLRHPGLKNLLYEALTDPVLFMRLFTQGNTDRLVLRICSRSISSSKKLVLKDLANNYCRLMDREEFENDAPQLLKHIKATMKLGMCIQDAGWHHHSTKLWDLALRLVSHVEDVRLRKTLVLDCTQQKLRSKSCTLKCEKAASICESLLKLIDDDADNESHFSVIVKVAGYHFKSHRFDESLRWITKAVNLIDESTAPEAVIEILQLGAYYNIIKGRFIDSSMLACQAILWAKQIFGHLHRRYADTLYIYGFCLVKMNAFSDAIFILKKVLYIITTMYGTINPYVAVIYSDLAEAYRNGRQTLCANIYAENAIRVAKRVTSKSGLEHFTSSRHLVSVRQNNAVQMPIEETRATPLSSYQMMSLQEIKEYFTQLNVE